MELQPEVRQALGGTTEATPPIIGSLNPTQPEVREATPVIGEALAAPLGTTLTGCTWANIAINISGGGGGFVQAEVRDKMTDPRFSNFSVKNCVVVSVLFDVSPVSGCGNVSSHIPFRRSCTLPRLPHGVGCRMSPAPNQHLHGWPRFAMRCGGGHLTHYGVGIPSVPPPPHPAAASERWADRPQARRVGGGARKRPPQPVGRAGPHDAGCARSDDAGRAGPHEQGASPSNLHWAGHFRGGP